MINLERKLNQTGDRLLSNETMKNGSNHDRTEFLQKSWILAEVISVLIVCASIWCLTALVTYRAQRAKSNGGNNKIITMINVALVVPIMTILSCLSTQVVIIGGLTSETNTTRGNHVCEVANDLSLYMYALAIPPTYFFLWYRMRMIYTQPTLHHLDTKVVKFFSHFLIALLLFGGSFATIKASIPHSYVMSEVGCVNVAVKMHDYVSNYIAAGTLLTSQLILFGLFLHPLLHHRYKVTIAQSLSKKSRDGERSLQAAIRMATVSTAICLFSDTLALMLVVLAMPSDSPKLLDRTVYDLSLLLNLISVILCFKHYKRIMLGLKPVPITRKLTTYRNNLASPAPTSPTSFASSFF